MANESGHANKHLLPDWIGWSQKKWMLDIRSNSSLDYGLGRRAVHIILKAEQHLSFCSCQSGNFQTGDCAKILNHSWLGWVMVQTWYFMWGKNSVIWWNELINLWGIGKGILYWRVGVKGMIYWQMFFDYISTPWPSSCWRDIAIIGVCPFGCLSVHPTVATTIHCTA